MAAVPQTNLLPAGRSSTPEGTVVNPGAPAGYIDAKKFGRITRSISVINRNLAGITQLLQKDLTQGQDAQVQQDLRDKQRVDNIKKEKKENFIEGAIQNTLVKPVKKLGKKATDVFGNFFKALTMIFAGWLIDKGGKALAAFQSGDTNTLLTIRDNVLKAFAVAGGIFLLLNGGIPLIFSAVSALISTIVSTIPAILALLANPAVWIAAGILGAGIALTAFLTNEENSQTPTTKRIRESVRTEGTTSTLEKLQKELEEKTKRRSELNVFNPLEWNEYMSLGTEIAELKENIEAVSKGYESKNDPMYRRGLPPAKELLGDVFSVAAFDQFEKDGITDEQRLVFAQMADISKRMSGNTKAQDDARARLKKASGSDKDKIQEELKKLEAESKTITGDAGKIDSKVLTDAQKMLLLTISNKSFQQAEGRPMTVGDKETAESLMIQADMLTKVSEYKVTEESKITTPGGSTISKPETSQETEVESGEKSTTIPGAKEEKTSPPKMQPVKNQSLEQTITQPFKKESKVQIVPFNYQDNASGYEGDENYREGEATGIPDMNTSNPNNDYLLHFRTVYGVGK
jgi:hypothetical protein